ncbi:MAG: cytochrome c biogenesis CcdA family protein [Gaiellaceae bacterium]
MIELGAAGLAAAFAAGFVSFLSPCVLPLVPGYLSLVSGVGFDDLAEQPRRVVAASVAFVAGFGAVFVLLGAGAAWFGDVLLANRRPLEIAAGVFIVLAGLVYARVPLPLSLLRERRLGSLRRGVPLLSGAAFAIAWTPCVGPTLAAILALSAAGASPAEGAVLLAVYALGLGIPFVLFALGFARALAVTAFLRRHARGLALTSGAMLVVFGVLLATGQLVRLTTDLARFTGLAL